MKIFFYVLTAIGSLIGGYFLFLALTAAESAPQEASLAAMAVAFAVLPYCFARAVSLIDSADVAEEIRLIAQHFQRIEQEAGRRRIEQTRQQTGAGSPFAPTGIRPNRPSNASSSGKWPEG